MKAAPFLALALAGCVAPSAVAPPPTVLAPEQRNLLQEIAATPRLATFATQLAASLSELIRVSIRAPREGGDPP